MYAYSEGQFLFDRVVYALFAALKLLLKLVIYAPLWFTGYVISTFLLDSNSSGLAWVISIAFIGIGLYQFMFFLKGLIIGMMETSTLFWIPLFLVCVTFTCIAPCWYFYGNIKAIMMDINPSGSGILTWISVVAFAALIYSRYLFHLNSAPAMAYPAFQLGISIANRDLIGNRSTRLI